MNIREKLKARLPEITLLILTLSLSISLTSLTELQPTISDSIGYVVAGQGLGDGHGLTFTDAHNINVAPFFYLHAFRMVDENTVDAVFGYPPGYPILIGISIFLSRQAEAAYYIVPLLATIAIPLTYWLGWLLTESKWVGIWSALILSSTLTFWQFSTAPWSEIPSLIFLVGGIGAYIFSRQRIHSKQVVLVTSTIGGILIGYSFFIRYTNIILVMPTLIFYELYTARTQFFKKRIRWYFFVITGMFAGGVLLFNWINFGGPFNSIYNTPELGAYPWPYFSLNYAFGPSPVNGFSFYEAMAMLWDNFHILLLLVPFGWIYMKRPNAIISGGITLTTLSLYSIYAFAPKEMNARFLLPMFPFLSIAIASGGVILIEKFLNPRWFRLLFCAAIGLLFVPVVSYSQQIQLRNKANTSIVEQVKHITSQTPENSIWLSSALNDLIIVYGNRSALNYRRMLLADPDTGQFDQDRFEACLVQTIDQLLETDAPVYFILDQGWNTSRILQEYFTLSAVQFDKDIFRVSSPTDSNNRNILSKCME